MAPVAVVIIIAVIQFVVIAWLVGRARHQYGIKAPATTGHEVFERWFRVQQNTLELLVVMLPAMWLFARYVSATWAAALGLVYFAGRLVYLRSYVADPASRSAGFGLSMLPVLAMVLGTMIGAGLALLRG